MTKTERNDQAVIMQLTEERASLGTPVRQLISPPTRSLSMNHQAKPKLKNSKTQISEFMSFGLLRPLNRKKPYLISHDLGISGSWSLCTSDGWRSRLPMNLSSERGIYAASPALRQRTLKRHKCRAPAAKLIGDVGTSAIARQERQARWPFVIRDDVVG